MRDLMWSLVEDLYPICRSITGDGVRRTLDRIELDLPAPLLRSEVQTGAKVLDWTIPNEWNIRDAYIADRDGARVVDFNVSNLHVVSYSMPVRARMSREELLPHLHTLPNHPEWIPYRTSYYVEAWDLR
jgi:aminopeptidase-like protein